MAIRNISIITILLWMTVGCATIPEEQCLKINWYDLGVKDGLAGYLAEDRLARHRDACGGVKVVPDGKRYHQGHQVGLIEYCHLENAVREGLAGHRYTNVCDPTFKKLYQAAYLVYSLRDRIEDNLRDISRKENELRDKKTSPAKNDQLRSKIRELDRRRESLRDELYSAERDLEHLRHSYLKGR